MLVGCDNSKFQLLALFIDLNFFTLGFGLLIKDIYKKLSPEFISATILLALSTPALSITEYYQAGEIIFTFTMTVWILFLFNRDHIWCMIAFMAVGYQFAPNTLWINLPIFFCGIGMTLLRSPLL
jgi:hypothetical protein